jgi:hypothetical protein
MAAHFLVKKLVQFNIYEKHIILTKHVILKLGKVLASSARWSFLY